MGQGALGKQLIEILDAAFGMKTLIERIVQVASVQSRFRIVRMQLLQRPHDLKVRFRQCQAFRLRGCLGRFEGPVEGSMGGNLEWVGFRSQGVQNPDLRRS